jgi:hypothetical protein
MVENPWLREPSSEDWVAMFTQAHRANWQPLVWVSHVIDFKLFRDDAGLHHLSNVFYHAINTLLVYWFIQKLLPLNARKSIWIAFWSAFIFAVHPQHVQSVAWLVERKDTLSVMFSLLSLVCWVSHFRHNRKLSLLFFLFALMSKPMAVTLPLVMILLDIYPLKRHEKLKDIGPLIAEKWYFLLLSLVVGLLTLTTQQIAMSSVQDLPVSVRVLNAMHNSWFYVGNYLWPVNLSPFYPYPQDIGLITKLSFWLPGLFFLLATSIATWVLWLREIRWPALCFFFYLITFAPVSGLIQVGPARALDYYVYFATLPLGTLIVLASYFVIDKVPPLRLPTAALSFFVLLVLVLLSVQNITLWRNEQTLWTRAFDLYPESAYINRNLASVYFSMGDLDNALVHAELSERYGSPDTEYLSSLKEFIRQRLHAQQSKQYQQHQATETQLESIVD